MENIFEAIDNIHGIPSALAEIVREGATPEEIRAACDWIFARVQDAENACHRVLDDMR